MIIAGGDLRNVPLSPETDFIESLEHAVKRTWPKPKMLIISFPANPTTQVVDLAFFERIVAFAKEHELMVLHDFAYAEIAFEGYKPPSILEVPGAKDIAIEFVSLSKSHSMAGWRVGFACGNREMIGALTRIKSYLDYGMPQSIQIGAISALRGPQDVRGRERGGLQRAARCPGGRPGPGRRGAVEDRQAHRHHVRLGSRSPSPSGRWAPSSSPSCCSRRPKVAVSAGVGFGEPAKATCALRWWRTSTGSGRRFGAFGASCARRRRERSGASRAGGTNEAPRATARVQDTKHETAGKRGRERCRRRVSESGWSASVPSVTGVAKVLTHNADVIEQRLGFPLRLVRIADLDTESDRGSRSLGHRSTTDAPGCWPTRRSTS